MTLTASPIVSVDPATEEVVARYDAFTAEQATAKVAAAHEAWLRWRGTSFAERAALVRNTAVLLRERKERPSSPRRRSGPPARSRRGPSS